MCSSIRDEVAGHVVNSAVTDIAVYGRA